MKCILEDNYGEKKFNTVKEALFMAIVAWEYNTSHPKCIKKTDNTVIKTENEIFKCYEKWWDFIYSPKLKGRRKRISRRD